MAYWTPKLSLCQNYFLFLKSHFHTRHFLVKFETEYTELSSVNATVPKGSVLGPLLYLLYAADLLTSLESTIGTSANDTAVVATHDYLAIALQKLQSNLFTVQNSLKNGELKQTYPS
jgi:hypothetical protein